MSMVSSPFRQPMVQPAKLSRVQPKFTARTENTPTSPGTVQPFDSIEEGDGNAQKHPNAFKRAAKVFLAFLGVTAGIGILTSETWVPIAGVGATCRKNAPEGAIAKIFPIAGLGPAKGLCPSAFVMDNGDIFTNDAPSWGTFHKKGHADPNGLVSHQDGVVGRLVGDKFYQGNLANGLLISQIDTSPTSHFDQIASDAAPSKKVDANGTVKQVGKWGYVTLTEGKTELIGDAKGKKLADLPKDQQTEIKAAAAANSYLWAKS